jgi:hypothetical protein
MFNWRNTLIVGAFFVLVGILYFAVQGDGRTIDRTGVLLLILTGVSMVFGLAVLVRGSRDV